MASINTILASMGTMATSPAFAADGSGSLVLANISPNIAMLVELRNISAALNTTNQNLDQQRAEQLYVLTTSGLGS